MRRTSFIAMAGLLVCISGVAWAQNPSGPTYQIQFARGITIDGAVADWTNAEWVTYDATTVTETGGTAWGEHDASTRFAMMYDNDALYLAAEVTDDFISYVEITEFAWWERDGVQWFLDFTGNAYQDMLEYPDTPDNYLETENSPNNKWLPGEIILAFGATEDQSQRTTQLWPTGTRGGNRTDGFDVTLEDGTVLRGGGPNTGWQTVVDVIGTNRYIVEARVPFSSIETSPYYSDPANPDELTVEELALKGWSLEKPATLAGSTILMTHLTIDTDKPEGGYDAQAMYVGDGDMDSNWTLAEFAEATDVADWELR